MNVPHGEEGHEFDLRCDECHRAVSAKMDVEFVEKMIKEGLTAEQAEGILNDARRIGRELREANRALREADL